jgi:hypothetical protein
MEINYGDAHFRRSDGGQTLQNPFMESYIMDAFATEIGGEVLLQKNGLFGMVGITNGMIKGHVDSVNVAKNAAGEIIDDNTSRNPSLYVKGGVDKQITSDFRVRVSGSLYHNSSQAGSGLTLYSGDRAGSNYQNVMERVGLAGITPGTSLPASTSMFTSGRLNPGFSKKVTAAMFNGFVKYKGLELFGTYETANGRTRMEKDDRGFNQLAGDILYRLGKNENLYVGARYNTVTGKLQGMTDNIKVDRLAFAGGWFMTKNVLMKAEYVIQNYKDFAPTDFRSGGKFKGYVIEAVVGF